MECSEIGVEMKEEGDLGVPVDVLPPATNLLHLGNIELPRNVTSARILKLPPGYVILKDAHGSFKGLAKMPFTISPNTPPMTKEPTDKVPSHEVSTAADSISIPVPISGVAPVPGKAPPHILVQCKKTGLYSKPIEMPKYEAANAPGKISTPTLPQEIDPNHQGPQKEGAVVPGKNFTLSQPQAPQQVVGKNPIPIQPKGILPRQPWIRDPPNWRKEPIVLYSGAPLEDDTDDDDKPKSRREKKPPPKSLPCPKKLDDILPKFSYKYHISSLEDLSSPDKFKAEVRVNITQKEAALQWLREFEETSGANFRTAKTFKEKSLRLIFKKTFRCHKNTLRKDRKAVKKQSSRNVGCEAKLSITVKNPEMKMSSDGLLTEFPCVIVIYHNHCHSLTSLDSLRYRRPQPEMREKFATMFKARITPSAALRLHKLDLEKEYGDKYPEVINDASKCPLLPWCYRVYYDVCGKKVKDGKKKSNRRSYSSGKKKIMAANNMVQAMQQSCAVMADFNSENCGNISTSEDNLNIGGLVTLSGSQEQVAKEHNQFENQSDEVQSSINSLYQYEYMSDNMVRENDLMECESAGVLVDNNAISESGVTVGNLSNEEGLLSSGNDSDFHDNHEILHDDDLKDFEDNCENLDEGMKDDGTLSTGVNIDNVENYVELESHTSAVEVNQAAVNLEQIFNNLRTKLFSEPGIYLSAVQKFVSNFESTCKSNNPSDLNKALSDFGCSSTSSYIMSPPTKGNDVPKIVENLIDQRKSFASSTEVSSPSGSSKRKLLVLRMDPSRFNQILGRVTEKKCKVDLLNI